MTILELKNAPEYVYPDENLRKHNFLKESIDEECHIFKGCSDDVVNFFKIQLMTDIPDRVKSGNLLLILDGGTYTYDDSVSEWKIK